MRQSSGRPGSAGHPPKGKQAMAIPQEFVQRITDWLWDHGARVVIIVLLAIVVIKLGRAIVRRVFSRVAGQDSSENKKRADTLSALLGHVVSATTLVVAAVMVLSELGVNVGPVLAAAGIVLLHLPFLLFVAGAGGIGLACKAGLITFADAAAVDAGIVWGLLSYLAGRRY